MTSLVNADLERELLGCLLAEPEQTVAVHATLGTSAAFGVAAHRHLFIAVCQLVAAGTPVDGVTLPAELARAGVPDVGDLLAECADAAITPRVALSAARQLRELATRREVLAAAHQAVQAAADPTIPIDATVSATVEALVKGEGARGREPVGLVRGLVDVMTDLEHRAKLGPHVSSGIPSMLPSLDALTDGWQRQDLIVVAARPSTGKTAFALACAKRAAEEDAGAVLFVSREMGERALYRRLLGQEAGVNIQRVRSLDSYHLEYAGLSEAARMLSPLPLVVDERADTPGRIRLACHRARATHGKVALVIVDYLQLLASGKRTNGDTEEIGKISNGLKRLAVEEDVPVMALSQLSRANDREKRRPRMSDLRNSGAIEQDADLVLFLHRGEGGDYDAGMVDLDLAKHRNGEIGMVHAEFDRATQRWRGWLRMHDA